MTVVTGSHASNSDVLNVEVEFRGEDAELIDAARSAMGPAGITYADAIQRLAIVGARVLREVEGSAAPHIIALIATAALAPWLLAWAIGGS